MLPSETIDAVLGGITLYGGEVLPDEFGVHYSLDDISGWWDGSKSTGSVTQNDYADGGHLDEAFAESRTLVVKGEIWADDPLRIRSGIDRLKAAIPFREPSPLVVVEFAQARHAVVRQDGRPLFPWNGGPVAQYNIQLVAPDFRRFGGDGTSPQYQRQATLPVPAVGTPVPWTVPLVLEGEEAGGSILVSNAGDAPPAVTGTLVGPLTNPIIYTDDGQRQQFRVVLGPGEVLHLDFDNRRVEAGGPGGPSRRGTMVGRWITFAATETRVRFNATAGTPDARLLLRWSDANS